jgi:hypothetical protein
MGRQWKGNSVSGSVAKTLGSTGLSTIGNFLAEFGIIRAMNTLAASGRPFRVATVLVRVQAAKTAGAHWRSFGKWFLLRMSYHRPFIDHWTHFGKIAKVPGLRRLNKNWT